MYANVWESLRNFIAITVLILCYVKENSMKSMGKNMPISKFCLWIEDHHGCLQEPGSNVSSTRGNVSSEYQNTKKRVENKTSSGVFLTRFKVFG